jgi:DnaA family protein
MNTQLPLGITWRDQATFSNFITGENAQLVESLRATNEKLVFLWGEEGCGKSHLLQAVCNMPELNAQPVYLPMLELKNMQPAVLEGMEIMSPVCIDDVHLVAGNKEWEEAVFHLFNRVREQSGRMIVSASGSPANINIQLPDLVTRLGWGTVYQVKPLSDEGKKIALQQRAQYRGLQLPDEVVEFVLRRSSRDTNSLFQLLDRLDIASLVEQRKLTIPFVKQYLQ